MFRKKKKKKKKKKIKKKKKKKKINGQKKLANTIIYSNKIEKKRTSR